MAVKKNSIGGYDDTGIRSIAEELAVLRAYDRCGVPIFVDDKRVTPEEWADIVSIHEDDVTYMKDLVGAETGNVIEIRFDKVPCKSSYPKPDGHTFRK